MNVRHRTISRPVHARSTISIERFYLRVLRGSSHLSEEARTIFLRLKSVTLQER
jgi:hypothetical protein